MIVLPRSRVLWRQLDRVSTGGWLLGLLFFALALTPSLIPRHFTTQGILCGCAFAAGYGIGVFLEWLWDYLELRWPSPRLARWIGRIVALACLILAVAFLWFSTGWQNSIRAVMGVAPVEARQPWFVAAIAVVPAAILIGLGTLLVQGVRLIATWLARIIPRRVALAGAILVVGVLAATIGEGVVGRGLLYAADRFYGDFDRLAASQAPAPVDPLRSGSAASLIDWDTIGLDARIYVQSGPSVDEIADVTGRPAIEPLRVYVGLRSAETPETRAELALREMDRVGAFDRSILVLIMPVGTGWVEPAAIDTLEFLHGGDVASVAVQYSYLTSWLSLVSEPDVGVETARSLFSAVYARWSDMPEDARPRLYLHGLSLGAYSSAASSSLYDILADPFDGALWVGPPFATATWLSATINREPGSPWWLPSVGDGSVVRFSNGDGDLRADARPWGPLRTVFLQYPSDPIVFFEPAMLWREPVWLSGPRAEGVSDLLDWYPVVTFLQLLLDMALAQTAPIGFGHVYAPQDYFDAWLQVTQPPGWTQPGLDSLRQRLARHGERGLIDEGWFRSDAPD
ncbi:MAG: alpha/beta-hydrolase family protein [Alphaproteobacteria bacterium]|nr:alpha/beta-hydrolase family protein [Alphaproteobacteria bacterium]MBU1562280.1 alpha/beta-hydrolase family protein [Alphaproteobacteria bacterium]MBU2302748.1 alpha/beta-hydrolase family protein [Alphaproteobacteria bacterium]MBU2369317.1 alpha/beta-hydrolase family protein [Alphaproteobacteria bacterium]